MRRALMVVVLGGLLAGATSPGTGMAAESGGALGFSVPSQVEAGLAVAVQFRLPGSVAAIDGRLFFDTQAAEVVGLAPVGGGTAFRPVEIPGGVAFGAYDLTPKRGYTVMRVVIAPRTSGQLQLRLVIDATADAAGKRLPISGRRTTRTLSVQGGTKLLPAPAAEAPITAPRTAGTTRGLFGRERISILDLDIVRAGWEVARANGSSCGIAIDAGADANGDACVDIVDVQAVLADQGRRVAPTVEPGGPLEPRIIGRPVASLGGVAFEDTALTAASAGPNFVVDSTADTADAMPGDGVCADSSGNCTLRAAITEANWWRGDNRIEFNLLGTAPVRIQLLAGLPTLLIQDRTGGLTIDGYTQPGAQVNTAQFGSNAIMGVEIRGTGSSPQAIGLRITSPNNTLRGLLFNTHRRSIVVDGGDAQNNRIVGNWVGYNPNGSTASYNGNYNILLNTGASNNFVGSPALEDRNVSGRATHAIDLYGPGTNGNVIQNNLLCTTPSGTGTAQCSTGIDHNHGPKNGIIGGTNPSERNIIGRTTLNGIEYSHGWDPAGADHLTWQINNNSAIGNWVGFRGDGSYDPVFRSAQNNPGTNDNGNGINVYDGANFNLIEGNYVASVYDGIQTMSPNATGNVIRNNIIGISPLGQAAPLTRFGIVARLHTISHVVEGNLIRNAAFGGIGLTQFNVRFVRLSRNIVMDTNGPAIHLEPNPNDPTTGANDLQPAPVITSATTIFVNGTGTPNATVEVYRASRPAGQSGLPVEYLGATTVAANGSWAVPVSVTEGTAVTALQIRASDDTSALGMNVAAVFEAPPSAPTADFEWGQQATSLEVNFTDTSTGAPTTWHWDFGDGDTSAEPNPTHAYAAAGEYTVVLTASNAGGPSERTRQVTVSAPTVPPGGFVAADAFSRSVMGGWGSAEIGGTYTTQGTATSFSVGEGAGSMIMPSAGASRSALLNGTSERDVDIKFRMRADKAAAGGSYFIYAVARRNGNSEYRPRLIFNANGTVSVGASVLNSGAEASLGPVVVVPGLSQAPSSFVWLRADVTGSSPTTLRVKAWADGQAEPAGWMFIATDSSAAVQAAGSLGLRIYVSGGASNAPVTFGFDDYTVGGPPPPPPPPPPATYAADAFERTLGNGWGTADVGGTYTLQGASSAFSVGSGLGQINLPSAGANRSALLDGVAQRDVDITFRVSVDKVASGGAYYVYAVARRNGNNAYRPKVILNVNGTVSAHAGVVINNSESSLGPAVVVPGLTQAAGSFIWVRAQVSGADATTIRVKAWADGAPEPIAWQFSVQDSTAGVQGPGGVGLRTYLAGNVNNGPVVFGFDDLSASEPV